MDLHHVLCPFDFSEVSSHALDQATALAHRAGARLTVLHVSPADLRGAGMHALDTATLDAIETVRLEDLRGRVTQACHAATQAGVPIDITIAAGAPVPVILACAASNAVDLIVMGTHGASGVEHLILGSVTEKVLRKASCPVLTVPPRAHAGLVASFSHVLCAVDFSEVSNKAAEAAAAVAGTASASITLLHVLEWPWHEPPVPNMAGVPPAQAEALLEYRRYLATSAADALNALAASSLPGRAVSTLLRFGRPHAELLDAAREGHADLIVLGVRGRGAIDLGFFGSTANHVVRRATCPVLTVRA